MHASLGTGPNSARVSRPLTVGEPISYVVRIPNLGRSDARIGRCWARDDVGSEIQLSDDKGCTVQSTGNVWGNFRAIATGSGKVFYNDIRAWSFPTSNRVNIFCNLHVCASQCPPDSCSRRKRRQVARIVNTAEDIVVKDSKPVEGDILSDVIAIQGSFEVIPLQREEVLNALPNKQLLDVQVVTGAPQSSAAESAADSEGVKAENRICINQVHFGVGVALLLLIVLVSLALLIFFGFKTWIRSKRTKRLRTGDGSYGIQISTLSRSGSLR